MFFFITLSLFSFVSYSLAKNFKLLPLSLFLLLPFCISKQPSGLEAFFTLLPHQSLFLNGDNN